MGHSLKISTILPVLVVALLFTGRDTRAAGASLGPLTTVAVVPSTLSLDMTILDAAGSQASSLDFGQLSRTADTFGSNRLFRVVLSVSGQGVSYEIRQDVSPFTRNGGNEAIPEAAFLVRPLYLESENSGLSIPSGAQLAPEGPASGTRTLFSDPTGSSRTISLAYSMASGVPFGLPSGSYTGTLQFTLVST